MKRYSAIVLASLLVPSLAFGQTITQLNGPSAPGVPGLQPMPHPGYVVGDFYIPWPGAQVAAAPANPGANKVTCGFGVILQALSIDTVGAVIAAASAGNNLQLAIYNNGSWGRPGTLVVATPNISTTSAVAVTGAAVASLQPGSYWFCDNMDNATSTVSGLSLVSGIPASTVGSAALARVISTSAAGGGITVAQTFGTWPNFVSGTAWADTTTNIVPAIAFHISSVP